MRGRKKNLSWITALNSQIIDRQKDFYIRIDDATARVALPREGIDLPGVNLAGKVIFDELKKHSGRHRSLGKVQNGADMRSGVWVEEIIGDDIACFKTKSVVKRPGPRRSYKTTVDHHCSSYISFRTGMPPQLKTLEPAIGTSTKAHPTAPWVGTSP